MSDEFSIYSYLSYLGTGFPICFIIIVLQVIIPSILVSATLSELTVKPEEPLIDNLRYIFCVTDDDAACHNLKVRLFCSVFKIMMFMLSSSSIQLTTLIVVCIQILYMTKVVSV